MQLSADDRTFIALKAWAIDQMKDAHLRLSAVGMPERDADVERGRIAAFKQMVGLADPKPDLPSVMTPQM